ncbi:hypothetical protein CPAV1605_563 [seawater metagenome]|uniref:Phenylalanyl-tRNA synthetase domain-containing protein n=1 Tax=seawater metagenome TaxID=1561972 RepID=A0A5E8CHF9_9ZZZZ
MTIKPFHYSHSKQHDKVKHIKKLLIQILKRETNILSIKEFDFKPYSQEFLFDSINVKKEELYPLTKDTLFYPGEATPFYDKYPLPKNEIRVVTGIVGRHEFPSLIHNTLFTQFDIIFNAKTKKEAILFIKNIIMSLNGNFKYIINDISVEEISDDNHPFQYSTDYFELMIDGIEVASGGLDFGINNAWGVSIGLERLAMILYNINDIRHFWEPKNVKGVLMEYQEKFILSNTKLEQLRRKLSSYRHLIKNVEVNNEDQNTVEVTILYSTDLNIDITMLHNQLLQSLN